MRPRISERSAQRILKAANQPSYGLPTVARALRWTAVASIGFRGGKRVRRNIYGNTKGEVRDKLNRVAVKTLSSPTQNLQIRKMFQ